MAELGQQDRIAIDFITEKNRGLKAAFNVTQGSDLLIVPWNAMIKQAHMKKDEWVQKLVFNEKFRDETKNKLATLWTVCVLRMVQQGDKCPFRPYINMLPTDTTEFPIRYTNETLKTLEPSPLYQAILEKQA